MIGTVRGWQIDLQNFNPIDVNIEDVARSLSFTHRFNGHINRGYTVAEHCIIMSRVLSNQRPHLRLEALLHDAGEAYTGDVITPIKELIPEIVVFCRRIDGVVMQALFPEGGYKMNLIKDGMYCMQSGVHYIDAVMARVESSYLRPALTQKPDTQRTSLFKEQILKETEKLQQAWHEYQFFYDDMAELNREAWLQATYIHEYNKLVKEVEAQ